MRHILCILAALLFSQSMLAQWEMFKRRPCGTAMLLQQNKALTRAINANAKYVKHEGTVTIPVILVNFSDVKFTINSPKAAFDQFFNSDKCDTAQTDYGNGNKRNHSSVATYFRDMSDGKFQPKFKVYGPVTVQHPETYYGGTHKNDNNDEKPQLLVKDALALIENSVSSEDLASFSADGKTIESVYILYAGVDQNDNGPATAVWANTFGTGGATLGGKEVRWYTMSGELSPVKMDESGKIKDSGTIPVIAGIGVACHEFTHALGLPDIYPTLNSARVDNQEMEYWDLMDGGEYSGNGFFPTAYTAFEKEQMGWPVSIETLNSNARITMEKSTEKGGTAYKIVNPSNELEYFMLECIQRRGWNKYQYGNGLLVYHVNLPSGPIGLGTHLNNKANYPGMAVVPADSACLSAYTDNSDEYIAKYSKSLWGDLFPGTGNTSSSEFNVTELSDAKPKPNFCWYNSAKTEKLATNKALKNIAYDTSTGYVTFDYIHDVATGILPVWHQSAADNKIYSLEGRYLGTDLNALPHGVYIVGGRKILK